MSMRCWIIGNGPSLKRTPLDRIKDPCYAVNRIHLIYPDTTWRPDVWIIADRSRSTFHGWDTQMHLEQGYPCWVRADIPRGAEAIMWNKNFPDTFIPFPECDHIDVDHNPTDKFHEPNLCKMGGSLYVAFQLAVYDGYDEIVFVGIDGNIRQQKHNHFSPEYADIDVYDLHSMKLANKNLDYCHSIMSREAKKRGIQILNATDGQGVFTMHRPVDIEDLL